jgi:hypothetical protein
MLLDTTDFQPYSFIIKPCLRKTISAHLHVSHTTFRRSCWNSKWEISTTLHFTDIIFRLKWYKTAADNYVLLYYGVPIRRAERSKAWSVFTRSKAETVGSNSTQVMDVCIVCVCSAFVLFCVQIEALRRADPSCEESYRLCTGLRNWKAAKVEQKAVDVCIVCVCVVLCTDRGLATSWSLMQGVLPAVYRIEKLKSGQVEQKAVDVCIVCVCSAFVLFCV